MLSVENLKSGYGRIEALHGVSITVAAGEIVTLVGANGAGKTTLLRAISGVQPITAGRILLEGRPIERLPGHARVALGIAQVPEGRQLFAPLSVEDNLQARRLDAGATPISSAELGAGLRAVSDAGVAPPCGGRHALGRPAADAGDRPRADGEAAAPAAR